MSKCWKHWVSRLLAVVLLGILICGEAEQVYASTDCEDRVDEKQLGGYDEHETVARRQQSPLPTILWASQGLIINKRSFAVSDDSSLEGLVKRIQARSQLRVISNKTFSVTDQFLTPPSGDKHDYLTMSPYMWPCSYNPCGKELGNCNKRSGVPWVSCDGEKNPQITSSAMASDIFSDFHLAITDAAIAYWYSGDLRYASYVAMLARIWFLNPDTKMNPNLQYAQLQPASNAGSPSGIIDIIKISEVLESIAVIKTGGAAVWTPADQSALNSWLGAMLTWLQNSPQGAAARGNAANNIAWWYYQVVLAMALHSGDILRANLSAQQLPNLVVKQIGPDGVLINEVKRPQSRQYVAYALTAIARCAVYAARTPSGNLWNNPSVRAAFAWPTKYIGGGEPWPYPDTQANYDWKFYAEAMVLASEVYTNDPQFCDALEASEGGEKTGFGVPPAAVHIPCAQD